MKYKAELFSKLPKLDPFCIYFPLPINPQRIQWFSNIQDELLRGDGV